MEQRLSLITLGVADIERSRAFYLKGLGWTESPASNDDVCFIQLNGFAFALWSFSALAKDCGLPAIKPEFSGIVLAYNARTRAQVDATLSVAQAAGARLLKGAHETFWGGYSGYFADLDGYAWEVAWNPSFAIDESGHLHLPG